MMSHIDGTFDETFDGTFDGTFGETFDGPFGRTRNGMFNGPFFLMKHSENRPV